MSRLRSSMRAVADHPQVVQKRMSELFLIKRADGLFEAFDDEALAEIDLIPSMTILHVNVTVATRSIKMNACLHKYCTIISGLLNDAGYSVLKVLKKDAEIPWNKSTVKELMWRPIQKVMVDKDSTTEASNSEYKDIHRVLDRHLSEKFGVGASWPNRFGD